jgi:putative peptide zinc metalloprotease protein
MTTTAPAPTPPAAAPLRLLPGTELLGPVDGSGLHEPPHLVRRPDGQVVQVSRLLYLVAQHADPGRDLDGIAAEVGEQLDLRIRPDQVEYLLEEKLHPLGLVTGADGSMPELTRLNPIFGLRMRAGVVAPRIVHALAGALRPLFLPPVVAVVLGALLVFDAWLLTSHGIGAGISHVIRVPTIALALFALTATSLAFHELGHATACRYGGGRPGAIGVGVFVVWPAFYTDVTDSYRLGRAGRLRTDLGGMYFNAIFSLGLAAAYLVTGFEPLIVAIVAQHVLVVDQFLPWLRLDGYYVMADIIGVADLFARIGPVLRGVLPGRAADPRVAELRPWARTAVKAWVVTTVLVLTTGITYALLHATPFLEQAWASLLLQVDLAAHAPDAPAAIAAGLSAALLLLPVLGLMLTYTMVCRLSGGLLARHRARRIAQCPPRRPSSCSPRTPSRPTGSTWSRTSPAPRSRR